MRSSRKFWTASLAICTALLVCGEPLMAFAQLRTPRRGIPGRREPAGSREPRSCIEPDQKQGLVGLVPPLNRSVTLSAYPTFMFYVPKHRGQSVYLELRDEKNTQVLHNVKVNTLDPKTKKSVPGIYSVTLSPKSGLSPKPGAPLEVNKNYLFYIVINCGRINPGDKEDFEVYSGGWLRRVEPDPTFARKLAQAKPETQPALYAAEGIWNETVSSLAALRVKNPSNPSYADDWKSLLKSVGLEDYSEKPLVNKPQ